ncbi:MAG: glycosyltransferase family 4 protein [Candidatus Promineofilum sp.]|nr:glycosyltransferase family 4 protein [Promineifilum sp.]
MHILLLQIYSSEPTPDYAQIASELSDGGHVVWVGSMTPDGNVEWHDGARVVATQGRSIQRGGKRTKLDLVRQVRRFIRNTQPDIVQINAHDLFRLIPLGMSCPPRFILDMRQINESYGATPVRKVMARLRNDSRGLIARTLFDRTTFLHVAGARQVLGDGWQRWATVVPMGVDPQFLMAKPPSAPDVGGKRPVTFVYSGRLTRIRRLERIIEAAGRVRQHTEKFRIVFMGYDGSDGHYAEVIQQRGLDPFVCIRPPVSYSQVPDALLEYDVALAYVPELPADWRYHPTLKVLEYRALGMPIIASDFEPNRELVEQEINGLLVPNSVEDIAQAMLRFIQDPVFLARCRVNAEAKRGGVTWDQVSLQYMELYHQLMEK